MLAPDTMEDDLAPSKTEGFKVGEKKTIDEYQKLGKFAPLHVPRLLHELSSPTYVSLVLYMDVAAQ